MNFCLANGKRGERGYISAVNGTNRLMVRITSIGLTIGCKVEILQNHKERPLLLFERDTVIALNRNDAEKIIMEKIE